MRSQRHKHIFMWLSCRVCCCCCCCVVTDSPISGSRLSLCPRVASWRQWPLYAYHCCMPPINDWSVHLMLMLMLIPVSSCHHASCSCVLYHPTVTTHMAMIVACARHPCPSPCTSLAICDMPHGPMPVPTCPHAHTCTCPMWCVFRIRMNRRCHPHNHCTENISYR